MSCACCGCCGGEEVPVVYLVNGPEGNSAVLTGGDEGSIVAECQRCDGASVGCEGCTQGRFVSALIDAHHH